MSYYENKRWGRTDTQCEGKNCLKKLTQKVIDYSMKVYGKPLCIEHQREIDILDK